ALRLKAGEIGAAVELLDQHLPARHLDRCDDELGPSLEHPGPIERQKKSLGHEERAVLRLQSVDSEAVELDPTQEDAQLERIDVDGPLQKPAALALRETAQAGTQIDRQRTDQSGRDADDRHHQSPAGEAKDLVRSNLLEELQHKPMGQLT